MLVSWSGFMKQNLHALWSLINFYYVTLNSQAVDGLGRWSTVKLAGFDNRPDLVFSLELLGAYPVSQKETGPCFL